MEVSNVAKIDNTNNACTSFSFSGSMMASSYFQLATEAIIETRAAYMENTPKSSGVNILERRGVAKNNIP